MQTYLGPHCTYLAAQVKDSVPLARGSAPRLEGVVKLGLIGMVVL